MTHAYPHLLAPGRIGALELRNRILLCPMGDSLANSDGTASERQLAYFEARALGGAALLLVGSVAVAYPAGSYAATQLAASDDAQLAGLRELADRAHRHDARIAAQLVHDGQNALHDIAQGRPLLVPSIPPRLETDELTMMVTPDELAAMTAPFTQPTSALTYREADHGDIAQAIEQYASAAARVQEAGFDAVEIHAGHGYLIDAFLSPASNRRADMWGGSIESRARLLVDVLQAVRARVGDELPVWCRLNSVEHFRDPGETLDDALRAGELAVEAGAAALHVSSYASQGVAIGITEAHTPHRPGALQDAARAFKARVDVPIITFGKLRPSEAEAALAAGDADFVAMGRKLLADPSLPAKLELATVDDVRPCIYQYRCIGNIFLGESVRCASNAATGREHEVDLSPAAHVRRVLVVGGGPAGLEAAHLLAHRGHEVELWEASDELGGLLGIGARTDEPLAELRAWLVRQVRRDGVEVTTGRTATATTVVAAEPDEIVLALGARRALPDLPGADLAHVRALSGAAAWLDDDATAGERVAIVGGGKPALSIAAHARRRGNDVIVLEPTAVFGVELGLPGRFRWVHELREAGVELRGATEVDAFVEGGVSITGGETLAADTVIVVAGAAPNAVLADEIRAATTTRVHVIGDAAEVRGIEGAMLDATLLASGLA